MYKVHNRILNNYNHYLGSNLKYYSHIPCFSAHKHDISQFLVNSAKRCHQEKFAQKVLTSLHLQLRLSDTQFFWLNFWQLCMIILSK
jgi:hypothetical protein